MIFSTIPSVFSIGTCSDAIPFPAFFRETGEFRSVGTPGRRGKKESLAPFLNLPFSGILCSCIPVLKIQPYGAAKQTDEASGKEREGPEMKNIPGIIGAIALLLLAAEPAFSGKPDIEWRSLNLEITEHCCSGNYDSAATAAEKALLLAEKNVGRKHAMLLESLDTLADLYRILRRCDDAEPLYGRALSIREKTLGRCHPSVAETLDNLADIHCLQGSYDRAEPLYKRSLAIREKSCGKNPSLVAASLRNLADLYRILERYDAAEPLYERALAIREKNVRADPVEAAAAMNSLAILYDCRGRADEAQPLY